MSEELVSIIIPCFNNENFIRNSIESAIKQTYKNIEIICINDGSTDNSANIIKEYPNIIFINETQNQGVIKARNTAIQKASGKYILPLDADDTIEPEYVQKAVKVFEENPDIGIVYCRAKTIGDKVKKWHLPKYSKNIIFANCIFATALFKKSDFEKVGGYKDYMQGGYEDWDLWLSMIELGIKPYRIDEYLFNYRRTSKIKSRNDCATKNFTKLASQVFKHHIDLYLNSETFFDRVFTDYKKKQKKYKKLYRLVLFTSIIEALVIIALILFSVYFSQ